MDQLCTGIDIIEIDRIRQAIERWQGRFLERVYTQREISLYSHQVESLAARFAGKEAVMKALGNDEESGITWHDVEILSGNCGQPQVTLHGKAHQRLEQLGMLKLEISLSHSRENAIALVIGLRER